MRLLVLGLLLMANPLFGDTATDDRTQDVLDYLGRRSPVSFSNQPALPNVGSPGPSAGPAGPSGSGVTPGGESGAAPVAVAEAADGPSDAATILNLLGTGIGGAKTATGTLRDLTGSEGGAPSGFGLTPEQAAAEQFGDVGPQGLIGGAGAAGPMLGPDTFLGGAAGPSSYGDVFMPSGPTQTPGTPTIPGLDIAGTGLSGAALATLVAQLVESGQMSPRQATGLLQSSGGLASNVASTLGPAKAGEAGGALAGTLGPEAAGLLGTAGGVLGGAGAVGSIALTLKNEFDALRAGQDDPRQYASAAGSELGLGAGAILGGLATSWSGPGVLIGAGAGGAAGTAIGQAIAQNLPPTHYMALRQHWGEVAADAVNAYGFGIEKAASNGGLPEIQQAMSQRYADGHVAAYLTLPEALASAIGVPAMTTFDQLTTPQFLQVMKAMSQTSPEEYERWVAGQGDVQYLDQGRAQQVSDATRGTALATLTTLMQTFQPILEQMQPVAAAELEASRQWAAGAGERDLALKGISPDAYATSLTQAGV